MGRRKVAEYSNTHLEGALVITIRIASEGIHTQREDGVLNKPPSVVDQVHTGTFAKCLRITTSNTNFIGGRLL